MIGVVIAVAAVAVLVIAALVVRGRRSRVASVAAQADDHVQSIASLPAEASADTVVPQPGQPSSARLRQCPRCGRHTVHAAQGDVHCTWCGLDWQQPADAVWPDVNLCLWIPPSDRTTVKEKT